MMPTFKSKTLITNLYSMNSPDSRGGITFLRPYSFRVCFANSIEKVSPTHKKSAIEKDFLFDSNYAHTNIQWLCLVTGMWGRSIGSVPLTLHQQRDMNGNALKSDEVLLLVRLVWQMPRVCEGSATSVGSSLTGFVCISQLRLLSSEVCRYARSGIQLLNVSVN
jgi:hypothetical protein